MTVLAVFVVYKKQVAATNERVAATNRNHEAARSALNAVAEIQSVTSVGSNYPQYLSTVQSAKIKFDAALRDYELRDAGDTETLEQLTEAFDNYHDAGVAWNEFIKNGEYGFVSGSNLVVKQLAAKYGVDPIKVFLYEEPAFQQKAVLEVIWQRASQNTNSITMLLKRER